MSAALDRLRRLVGSDRSTVPALLAARAAATPDAPFVRYRDRVWSYAQGWEESLRFAGLLQRLGAGGSPPRVASFLSKRPEALWAWFGTLAAGGVHVFVHRAHRGPLLADLMERSRAPLLVTEAAALPELPASRPWRALLLADEPAAGGRLGWDMVSASAPAAPAPVRPSDGATVLFTSGTTGRSKAVLLPHNMYVRGAAHLADAFGFTARDVFHDWLPLSHIGGQLHVTMSAVLAGACLAQQDGFSRSRFWDEVAAAGATVLSGFANLPTLLMLAPARPDDAASSLRLGLIGAIRPELQAAFERRFGVTLLDTYGMSECEPLTLPPPAGDRRLGSSGRVCEDFELAILDDEDRPLPHGTVGRIAVRPRVPDVMMQGYEGDEAATVAAWRNLWFHTQDLGRLEADGHLYFAERLKHSIRRGGETIASSEVEAVLRQHPAVADCAVVGVPDPVTGEAVKAVLALRPGAAIDPAALVAFCRERMARFMVPRYIEIRDALPCSDVGKVRRDELRALGPAAWDAEAGDR